MSPTIAFLAFLGISVAFALLLVNKLPQKFYQGGALLARHFRCAYCVGLAAGTYLYPLWVWVVGSERVLWLLWPAAAGFSAVLTILVQSVARSAAALEKD